MGKKHSKNSVAKSGSSKIVEGTSPINKRKRFLIYPRFQLVMIGWFFGLTLGVLFVFYFSNHLFINGFATQGIALGLPKDHIYFQFLDAQQRRLQLIFLLAGATVLVLTVIVGLVLSHRVAGPIVRMIRHLERGSQNPGPASELNFRKKDYFKELATAFNRYVQR